MLVTAVVSELIIDTSCLASGISITTFPANPFTLVTGDDILFKVYNVITSIVSSSAGFSPANIIWLLIKL